MKSLLAACLTVSATVCWAGLGEQAVAPGTSDASTTSAHSTSSGAGYTQVERRLASGTVVREFVSSAGLVFAVSWSGPFLPDLRELLGPHFSSFTQAAGGPQGLPGSLNALNLQRPDLVILSVGRMGSFQGRAWLPRQLPPGFDPRQIQ